MEKAGLLLFNRLTPPPEQPPLLPAILSSLALFPPVSPGLSLLVFYIPGILQPFSLDALGFPQPAPSSASLTLGKLAPFAGKAMGTVSEVHLPPRCARYLEKLRDLPPGQVVLGVAAAHAAWRRKGDGARLGLVLLAGRFLARLSRLLSFPLCPSAPVLVLANRFLLEGKAIREKRQQRQRLRFLARAAFTLPAQPARRQSSWGCWRWEWVAAGKAPGREETGSKSHDRAFLYTHTQRERDPHTHARRAALARGAP